MTTAEENVDEMEFLSDPVDRFSMSDLGVGALAADGEAETVYTHSVAESSMGDVGDAPLTFQLAINNGCEGLFSPINFLLIWLLLI
ncbi:hypothetical protein ZWY2020_058844 [Hordeum vulgare]|nr:hypothetical protein ZWY2020_058844 [Hordeum vulgare]